MKGIKIGCIQKCDISVLKEYPTLEKSIFKQLFQGIGEEYVKEKYKDRLNPTYPVIINSSTYDPDILEYRLDVYILTPDEFKYARSIEREYFDLQKKYKNLLENYKELTYRMEKL